MGGGQLYASLRSSIELCPTINTAHCAGFFNAQVVNVLTCLALRAFCGFLSCYPCASGFYLLNCHNGYHGFFSYVAGVILNKMIRLSSLVF
jgi:hypothetical protein